MTVNICENYPALSPFDIRRENYHAVICLFIRMIDRKQRLDRRENNKSDNNGNAGGQSGNKTHKYSGGYLHGNKVSRDSKGRLVRPARDDSWY